jgi:hypothetical protein
MKYGKFMFGLCAMLLFSAFFAAAGGTPAAEAFASGSGTSADPYIITTAQHLYDVRDHSGSYFELGGNINVGAFIETNVGGWLPIGINQNYPFNGTLDGKGYSITGLWVSLGDNDYAGLFGAVTNTAISNVNIVLDARGVKGRD